MHCDVVKFKRNKHQQHLAQLPKLSQSVSDVTTLYSPAEFRETLLTKIATAENVSASPPCIWKMMTADAASCRRCMQRVRRARNWMSAFWWTGIAARPYRCARGLTNADWYCEMAAQHPDIAIPVYGIPVNTREALGVLHLKGFIIDDTLLYSGASLNDVYLHQHDKYRYDRYQLIRNPQLADTMFQWIGENLKHSEAVNRLDRPNVPPARKSRMKPASFVRSCAASTISLPVMPATNHWPSRRWSGWVNVAC